MFLISLSYILIKQDRIYIYTLTHVSLEVIRNFLLAFVYICFKLANFTSNILVFDVKSIKFIFSEFWKLQENLLNISSNWCNYTYHRTFYCLYNLLLSNMSMMLRCQNNVRWIANHKEQHWARERGIKCSLPACKSRQS